jgi:hypothetical protein
MQPYEYEQWPVWGDKHGNFRPMPIGEPQLKRKVRDAVAIALVLCAITAALFAPLWALHEFTNRRCRKDGHDPRVGQTLYVYTGQRTLQCKKLGEAVCTSSERITIKRNGEVRIANRRLKPHEYDELAQADGFADFESFFAFFTNMHGLPFDGYVIRW